MRPANGDAAHHPRVTPVTLRPGDARSKMPTVIRRCAFGVRVVVVSLATALVAAGPALAQSVSPSPAKGPSVAGQVTGALASGSTLTIGIDGSMPGGWEALHLLEASIVSGGRELERLRFDIEDNKLMVGDQDLIVGTGATATSEYLRVSGADVILTTGGANLSFEVDAGVVKAIPEDAEFVLRVVDDFGASAEVSETLAAPEGAGITWATVVALIAAALFAGGFVGNVFANKRRPPPRVSVYDAVQRRVETDRAAKGRPR
ncbi:MAG TPA: hypothetical protein VFP13_09465 [Actinomycetota bacterium]|nr:hypothetical protein [Actinomycetota bacterium]